MVSDEFFGGENPTKETSEEGLRQIANEEKGLDEQTFPTRL